MFPDSNIVKNFACGKTKCSYIVTYGLAPYFKSLLNDTLSSLDCFVAIFDEFYHKFRDEDKWICMFAFRISKLIALQHGILIQNFLGKQQLRIFIKSLINVYLSWMKANFCRSLLMDPM